MNAHNDRQRAVNDRIRIAAATQRVDANRLRRSLVFHRLLARLGPHGFVLKGGFCLEVRLRHSARTTKDVDLVGSAATTNDSEYVLDTLDGILDSTEGSSSDGFTFDVGQPVRLRDQGTRGHAWRVSVTARLDGAEFERVKLDVVGQLTEVQGATEPLTVPPPVSIPGLPEVVIEAVDVYQHAAEKFHAYARTYAHDRPSSRVKDLVDLVLLIESGLLCDPVRIGERLAVVYAERDNALPEPNLPNPPGDWKRPYAALATELGVTAVNTDAAYELVADWYAAALQGRMTG